MIISFKRMNKLKRSIYYYYTPVEPYQQPHHPPIFNILSLSLLFFFFFFNFPIYCYTFSNFSLFYIFISPLLSTLILLFLYLFIFIYFWLFLFPSSYYKFTILVPILYIVFPHTKGCFSLSIFFSHF